VNTIARLDIIVRRIARLDIMVRRRKHHSEAGYRGETL
jgi:hypothetical protein